MSRIRTAIFGLGPIGIAVGKLAATRSNLEIVGAVDLNPTLVGQDLGVVLGIDAPLDVTVDADADVMLTRSRPDVVILCTQSSIEAVATQLSMIIEHGAHVVSTCEELSYPWRGESPVIATLNALSLERSVSVLGTGVNPGFAMDTMPLLLSAAAQNIEHVRVERVQDAGRRRLPLMRKVGVGITVEEFESRRASIGHIGLPESLAMVGAGLGWAFDKIERVLEPVVADAPGVFGELDVQVGTVLGVHENIRGFVNGIERVVLDLRMYAGALDPRDETTITGIPDLHMRIDGLHGDVCTAAVAVNSVSAIMRATPGLLTMRDMPLVSADLSERQH
ncbi:MAG: NAD(P)H-dependent amine dehydrogenase family protein [Acidimicrobiales bacterium]